MIRRSLAVALATALLPLSAAADLLQVYEMANGDPQLSAAESTRLATRKAPCSACRPAADQHARPR